MTETPGQLAQTQDLQPFLDEVVAAGVPGVLARAQTPTDTVALVSGIANRDTSAPMTPEMHVRVGSITKTFVATVILQLTGEGRLNLDDTVATVLPGLLPGGEVITVRQLLNHTSGLFNYTDDPAFLLAALTGKKFRPEELVLIAVLHPPTFAPGTDWGYSNTNYIVAGMITEKITGHSVGNQLRTRIFQPLGLSNTSYPTGAQLPEPYPRGYAFIDGLGYLDVTTTMHPSAFGAAGAIISHAADLTTFYQALLGGGLLHPDLLAAMKTTATNANGQDTSYGLGLMRLTTSCGSMWGHGGAVPGYHVPLACGSTDGTRSGVMAINSLPFPAEVMEPLNHAAIAIVCQALQDTIPTTAIAEAAAAERVVPLFDDWSALADIVKQMQRATLNLKLSDNM